MRILVIPSSDVSFSHGSGEVELLQLQLGFKLLGNQCDIVGPESDDFHEYDLYLFFSLKDDVLKNIEHMGLKKKAILFPQIDSLSLAQSNTVKLLLHKYENLFVHARNKQELSAYSQLVSNDKVLFISGWFVKPFIHTPYLENIAEKYETVNKFVLAFIGYGREGDLIYLSKMCSKLGMDLIVATDFIDDQKEKYSSCGNIKFINKHKYGSYSWYKLLSKCSVFYEPNNRITCSLLEALWLKKTVVSQHYAALNELLCFERIFKIDSNFFVRDSVGDLSIDKLMLFHVDEVCRAIIKSI